MPLRCPLETGEGAQRPCGVRPMARSGTLLVSSLCRQPCSGPQGPDPWGGNAHACGWYKSLKCQMPASPSDFPAWAKVTDPSWQSQLPSGRGRLSGLGSRTWRQTVGSCQSPPSGSSRGSMSDRSCCEQDSSCSSWQSGCLCS